MSEGFSGWTVAAACAIGAYASYKLVPWYNRLEETEQLLELAKRMEEAAEEPHHRSEVEVIIYKIKEYQRGIREKMEETDEEHKTILSKFRGALNKLNPLAKTA
jgi:hypothetical protein